MNELKKMQKMHEILEYILEHIEDKLDVEQVGEHFGYNSGYFSNMFTQYFGLSFKKFTGKLKMREAVKKLYQQESVKSIAQKSGYATDESFIKAFSKEFGTTPKKFLKTGMMPPDMPLRKKVAGKEISMQYRRTEEIRIEADKIPYESEKVLDVYEEIAYAYEHPEKYTHWEEKEAKIGVWWCGEDQKLYYLMGTVVPKRIQIKEDKIEVVIPEGNYAIFSIEKGKNQKEIAQISKALSYYIRGEWARLNEKVIDYMEYIYEVFAEDRCYIYIPLLKGMGGIEMQSRTGREIDTWIDYIDEHIYEELSARKIAENFYYSTNHFCDVFEMYYGISLSDYIYRRKLYWIARELKQESIDVEDVVEKYHFRSMKYFREAFIKEFHVQPEEYNKADASVRDLAQYYLHNKNRLKISYEYIDSFYMIGDALKTNEAREKDGEDIPGLSAWYFQHDFSGNKRKSSKYLSGKKEDKVSLWMEQKDENGNKTYSYILGSVVDNISDIPDDILDEMQPIFVSGGKYAVFETEERSDKKELKEAYHMLTICALYGWVKEYRVRVDFHRITFMRYKKNKLYAYVPIYE